MNDAFDNDYSALLRRQVEEEIDFLMSNGHQLERITQPCMFCWDTHKGYHQCNRLSELRQFHSRIIGNTTSKLKSERTVQSDPKPLPIRFESYLSQEINEPLPMTALSNFPIINIE